jgi:thiol-disulfide isomerase/thioredoxin
MKKTKSISTFLAAMLSVAVLGCAAYLAFPHGPAEAAPKSAAVEPPRTGGMEQFTLYIPPLPVPDIAFLDADGKEKTLKEFKGKVVLVNFWATWCAPCIRELPSIDRLQAELSGDDFTVLAINEDRGGAETAAPFLEKLGLKNLTATADKHMALSRAMGVRGMPSTYIVSRTGAIMGVLTGPTEWDSPEAKALIQYYVDEAWRN